MRPKIFILLLFILMAAGFLSVPLLAANTAEGYSADNKSATQTAQPHEKTKQGAASAPSTANEDPDDDQDDSFGDDSLDNTFDDLDDDF